MRMPFGKYRGIEIHKIDRNYLRWVSENTDIGDTHPRISAAIQRVLNTRLEPGENVTVTPISPPNRWGYTVRGGGQMRDGVTSLVRVDAIDGEIVREPLPRTRNLSGSGRSGSVDFDEPDEDGVYEWCTCSGSIRNHSNVPTMALRRHGQWYEIDTPADALAILTGREFCTPDGQRVMLHESEVAS